MKYNSTDSCLWDKRINDPDSSCRTVGRCPGGARVEVKLEEGPHQLRFTEVEVCMERRGVKGS